MKFGSHACQFLTFLKGNIKAKFCNKFSKYIEAVCMRFFNSSNFCTTTCVYLNRKQKLKCSKLKLRPGQTSMRVDES